MSVVGINYLAIDTGEFPEWEDFCYWEGDDVPTLEEVEPLLIKTSSNF
ncbi:hypothetical protein NUACC26_084000 [Scytonema sp. NUACC26]